MSAVFASVNVQFIPVPDASVLLVCVSVQVPLLFQANVAFIWWLSASFTVIPTAGCSGMLRLPLVGCSPVAVGCVFLVS